MKSMDKEMIEKIRKIFQNSDESEETTRTLLSLIGESIRKLDPVDQKQFSILWFFTDWINTQNIGKSIPALMLIKKLNEKLTELEGVKNDELYIMQLKESISLELLRKEMLTYLEKYGLPADMILFPNHWKKFESEVLQMLVNRPFSFPDPKNKVMQKFFGTIVRRQIKKREGIISFNINYIDRGLAQGETKASGMSVPALVVLTHDGSQIIIPM